ncbi:hypothetical protein LWI29_024609 [Acer saccharum]|uniref:Kinesin motor domain-containing protein n=1 Tax=Acer saccharum TaxID=4024 RepID=A0AA39V2N6_ACESA|nr:hypothetical protein LWI29_024609 [Acer saccharum]
MGGEELIPGDAQALPLPSGQEQERILVLVRVRPLNDKEISRNDVSDWECINNSTIIFKNSLPERSMFPAAYTFDRVFGYDNPTRQVYEEGAKEVSLAVVSGINSTIFAYGQTSSGKTYTMRGITECAVEDIYDYIERHKEREFLLKFSAMEIYNEAVRDLLSTDTTPLRLLDDPERGTVIEKLTEEILEDWSHLKELLSICEAQRQIGETSLNETSSRSHQILRLTIESSARVFLAAEKSSTLTATVNFVDLAGSERASQALSAGARLKEGCHINRSLLTLGTVIRKLSKGRNQHIPYRDSKLTRILQNSLGGNAKTAIICTMSPARSHVEQSRNTLLFASCAKEVSTNAQVNVVMSDKALVKQLQRELARLESEMKSVGSTSVKSNSASLLKEKELIIEQMVKEIRELTRQRDLAQSRVEKLLQSSGEDQVSSLDEYSVVGSSDVPSPLHSDLGHGTCNTVKNFDRHGVSNCSPQNFQLSEYPEDNFPMDESTPKFVGLDPSQGWEQRAKNNDEESCKEVQCIEMENSSMNKKIEADVSLPKPEEKDGVSSPFSSGVSSPRKEDKESNTIIDSPKYDGMKRKIQELQKTIDYLVNLYPLERSPYLNEEDVSTTKSIRMNRSTSCRAVLMSAPTSVWSPISKQTEDAPTNFSETPGGFYQELSESKRSAKNGNLTRKDSQTSMSSASLDDDDDDDDEEEEEEEDITSIHEQNENASLCYYNNDEQEVDKPGIGTEKNLLGSNQNLSESNNNAKIGSFTRIDSQTSISSASMDSQSTKESEAGDAASVHDLVSEAAKLQTQKQCDNNLVQQTITETEMSTDNVEEAGLEGVVQDALQPHSDWPMEFERKRREIFELWNACHVPLVHRTYFFLLFKGDPSDSVYMEVEIRRLSFLKGGKGAVLVTPASSLKDLLREREMLSKQIHQKFPRKERENLYKKWNISLNTKQRSVQLARRVWTDTKDLNHIDESAALVAKLVGFIQPGQAPKEIFGLSFLPRSSNRRTYSWSVPSLI